MKVAFFHDSILKHDTLNDAYYTSGGLTYSYLKRYLKYFESVLMVTRSEKMKKNDDKSKLSVSSGEGILFNCINGSSVKALLGKAVKEKVADAIKKTDFAIIRLPSMVGIIACEECNKLEKPYLVEVVGSPFCALWYYGKFSYKMMAPFYAAVNRHLIKKAKNVVYVTQEYLQRGYPNRHNNIGISDVNIEEVDNSVLDKRIERIKSYNDKTLYKIGLIGSMDVKYKGHDIAIKSTPILRDNGIKVEMHFLGKCSSDSRERLMTLAKKYGAGDSVIIDGVLPGGKAVCEWMDDKDLIILPSKTEGLPRALVEAMSRAVVCVGARTGGIPELLSDECILKRNNANTLASTLSTLVGDSEMMMNCSRRNFENSKHFYKNRLSRERDAFFEKILDRRVKILNVTGGMNVGGAETMLMNILRAIDKRNFQVSFLCYSNNKFDYEDDINNLGGRIFRITGRGAMYNIAKMKKVILENDFDVVHCHTHFNSVFPVIAAKLAGVKKIVVHSHSSQDIKTKSPMKLLYFAVSKRIINRYADVLIACGEKAGDSLFYKDRNPILIKNGIIFDDFYYSEETRRRLRKEFQLDDNAIVIGHVVRFAPVKNHDFILDVFEKFQKEHNNAILVLAGDGALRDSIKRRAERDRIIDKVLFLGLRRDVNELYNMFDVMLFPSLYEGVPLTLIEAQVNGVPIVASNTIDKSTDISDSIKFLSLKTPISKWTDALSIVAGKKHNQTVNIVNNGYNVLNGVKKLEEIYCG